MLLNALKGLSTPSVGGNKKYWLPTTWPVASAYSIIIFTSFNLGLLKGDTLSASFPILTWTVAKHELGNTYTSPPYRKPFRVYRILWFPHEPKIDSIHYIAAIFSAIASVNDSRLGLIISTRVYPTVLQTFSRLEKGLPLPHPSLYIRSLKLWKILGTWQDG